MSTQDDTPQKGHDEDVPTGMASVRGTEEFADSAAVTTTAEDYGVAMVDLSADLGAVALDVSLSPDEAEELLADLRDAIVDARRADLERASDTEVSADE